MSPDDVVLEVDGDVGDGELSGLHAAAFGGPAHATAWTDRLRGHSLCWVTARQEGRLVGFVNVIGDGGVHAVLLDTCVDPSLQGCGVGAALVARAAGEARLRGCEWLHADYEPHLVEFYEQRCGMRSTAAGLLRLT